MIVPLWKKLTAMSEEKPSEQLLDVETEFLVAPVETSIAANVPLFLRKLWKMVNDENAKNIISWNESGDGFIIRDQLLFISVLLPQYFKHNNMASFVRQLNFYDFHKVSNIDRDEIQFAHNYFLKDLPQTLAFIKRKCTQTSRARRVSENLTEIYDSIKELKSKHELVNSELQIIQQENAALWEELNSLRVKHSKQCKIINKLIHFLISYMQSRSMAAKRNRSVTKKGGNPKRLRGAPRLLEIGYRKNQRNDWDADSALELQEDQTRYTITEPSDPIVDLVSPERQYFENQDFLQPNTSTNNLISTSDIRSTTPGRKLQKLMPSVMSPDTGKDEKTDRSSTSEISRLASVSNKNILNAQPSTSQIPNLNTFPTKSSSHHANKPCNFKHNPKENFGVYIDNTQVKLNSIHDVLHNITPNEIASLCDILQDNYNQEFDLGNTNSDDMLYEMSDFPAEELAEDSLDIHSPSTPQMHKIESVPVQNVKKEIDEEFEKELAGMEVLSHFQQSTSTTETPRAEMSATAPILESANTSNNSDDVNNIIEDLISSSNMVPEDRISMEKALEEELAEIVASMPPSSLNPTRDKFGTKVKKVKK